LSSSSRGEGTFLAVGCFSAFARLESLPCVGRFTFGPAFFTSALSDGVMRAVGSATTYSACPLCIFGALNRTLLTDKSFLLMYITGGVNDKISQRTCPGGALVKEACFLFSGSLRVCLGSTTVKVFQTGRGERGTSGRVSKGSVGLGIRILSDCDLSAGGNHRAGPMSLVKASADGAGADGAGADGADEDGAGADRAGADAAGVSRG
jgi:hypothetical protein